MRRKFAPQISKLLLALTLASGCAMKKSKVDFTSRDVCNIPSVPYVCGPAQLHLASAITCNDCGTGVPEMLSPYDIDEAALSSENILPLSLQDCINQALATSKVIRDLGGTILRTPEATNSTLDPALVFSDPRIGEEAALSAFDANFFANNFFEENNRRLNNQFFGQNGFFNQYLNTTQVGLNKRSATGSLFTLRNVTIGDNNNQASNRLGRQSWESFFEAEMRQPLLQGAGTEFNRIAGVGALPGQLNGVLLARTRTDISLTDFERSVRDLVAEVENAYWDLYYSYRDLEAKIQLRDIAESTLAKVRLRKEQTSSIAQAEEQLLRFQAEVVDALNGRPVDGTRTNNGSSGGTFRAAGGVRVAERKLRLMTGMPINDGMLIQPIDAPPVAAVIFDWNSAISEAIQNRAELKRQRWVIKQRELELIANKNFLKPQLDLIGRYRYRGFGGSVNNPTPLNDAFFDGELQEWQLGVEYNLPVGFRRAHAAVSNSQLELMRETALLQEQERLIHLGLSNAIGEAKRSFESMSLQEKRLDAIVKQINALELKTQSSEKTELDVLLETHRRLLDARVRFHQAQVEYALALRNIHFEKGTLLTYNNVGLTETVPPAGAEADARDRLEYQDAAVTTAHRDPIISNSR